MDCIIDKEKVLLTQTGVSEHILCSHLDTPKPVKPEGNKKKSPAPTEEKEELNEDDFEVDEDAATAQDEDEDIIVDKTEIPTQPVSPYRAVPEVWEPGPADDFSGVSHSRLVALRALFDSNDFTDPSTHVSEFHASLFNDHIRTFDHRMRSVGPWRIEILWTILRDYVNWESIRLESKNKNN